MKTVLSLFVVLVLILGFTGVGHAGCMKKNCETIVQRIYDCSREMGMTFSSCQTKYAAKLWDYCNCPREQPETAGSSNNLNSILSDGASEGPGTVCEVCRSMPSLEGCDEVMQMSCR